MGNSRRTSFFLVLGGVGAVLVTLFVVGCSDDIFEAGTATAVAAQPPTVPPPTATPLPTAVPTPAPPKELVICQKEEPDTLFIYGGPSRAARNVLEAIYDGPIDTPTYQFQPTILEKLPSLADGDVVLRTVTVQEGERVVDVNNEWTVVLRPGVTVLDAAGREITFQGGVITMTQMVVTFKLRGDVTWADGQPLTADDSRYAFELAGAFLDNLSQQARLLYERTARYEAVDARTVVWTSLPGYRDTFYFYTFPLQNVYVQNFYSPLPRHAWEKAAPASLPDSEMTRLPLGWGPFTVEEWVVGERITLVRNPHYFRAAEGLPRLDRVTFRAAPSLRAALDLLTLGQCDVIAPDVIEGEDLTPLLRAAEAGTVQLLSAPSSVWEHLDFGIVSSTWVRRPNFFGDVRVRQAIAQCVDREHIVSELPFRSGAVVAHSYVAAEHPLYAGDQLRRWGYDPAGGRLLLEEVGWRDENGDGLREAHGVAGVTYGVPFTVTLLTISGDAARERVANLLVENLADCGIGVGVKYQPLWEFIADGPDGPVLGRQFDLALYPWYNDLYAPCELYLSSQIPAPANWWTTPNNPGYASDTYDAACQAALDALPGTAAYADNHRLAQRIFSQDLPALPLYFVPKLVAVRPGVSGVAPDATENLAWNVEMFDLER